MKYSLKPASKSDKAFLDMLRRQAYRKLFDATWGEWNEDRHLQHFAQTWEAGAITLIVANRLPVGMIQVLEAGDEVELAEIQILPDQQNLGLGTRVMEDVIDSARKRHKRLSLHLGLKNVGAYRLYKRLGFRDVRRSETHIFMEHDSIEDGGS